MPQPVKAFSRVEFKKSISAHKSYIVIVAIWNIEVCSRGLKGRRFANEPNAGEVKVTDKVYRGHLPRVSIVLKYEQST